MPAAIRLRRLGFRTAYALLRVYWFIFNPQMRGVKCVLTDGDAVLLVQHTYGPREWDLPGGAVHRREQPLDAARREMEEELGVRIEDWRWVGEVRGVVSHRHDWLQCFQAPLPAMPLSIDPGELAAARWFRRDELPAPLGRYVEPILARIS